MTVDFPADAPACKEDMRLLKEDLALLKQDLKQDVAALRQDLKQEIALLKATIWRAVLSAAAAALVVNRFLDWIIR